MSTPFSQPISPFLPPLGSIHMSVCSLCCVSISGFWTVFSFCIITPVSDFPFTWCPTCVCVCLQTLPLYKSYWIRDPPYFLTYLITSRGTLSHVLGCIQLFVTLWTVAHQALLSMGFSRQEYWSRWPCPSPGDLPDPEIKLGCPALHSDSLPLRHLGRPYFQIKSHSEVLQVKKSNRNLWGERGQPSVVVVRLLSRVWLFLTPLTAAHQASLPFTISQSLIRFRSIELVILSNYHILCHPLLLLPSIFSSIRVFSNELALPIRWPKYWNFSFSISPSNVYSGLISVKIN